MDYSLLLGIHDTQVLLKPFWFHQNWLIVQSCVLKIWSMQLAEDEDRETEDDLDEEDEEYDSGGSGVAMTPPGG